MAGTWEDGVSTTIIKLKNMRAYEEGVQARLASNAPGTSPVPAGEQSAAWDAGVVDAAAGTIDGESAYRGQQGPA
jgi:hypothetical protein